MSDTNICVVTGRLTKNIETSMTPSNIEMARFTLACNRMKLPNEQQAQADFIRVIAWRSTAKYLSTYSSKGDKLLVEGRIQINSYKDGNGVAKTSTCLVANRVQVLERVNNRGEQETGGFEPQNVPQAEPIADPLGITEDDLPF